MGNASGAAPYSYNLKKIMIRKKIDKLAATRALALDYIKNLWQKTQQKPKVLDIGAGGDPWALEYITAVVDPYIPADTKKIFDAKGITSFEFSAENPLNWGPIFDYIAKNGEFDFVICSHTLEDINYPEAVCSLINRVGSSGYIAVPSKYAELTAFECILQRYKGYHHHRWIYQVKDNTFVGYPKMGFYEYIDINIDPSLAVHTEICFLWEKSFRFKFYAPFELVDYGHLILQEDDLPLSLISPNVI